MKEWVIGFRDRNGEVRVSGLARTFYTLKEAEEFFEYLIGPWRRELEQKAAEEDPMKTNWARMTLAEKKQQKFVLLEREITPYVTIRVAPEWE